MRGPSATAWKREMPCRASPVGCCCSQAQVARSKVHTSPRKASGPDLEESQPPVLVEGVGGRGERAEERGQGGTVVVKGGAGKACCACGAGQAGLILCRLVGIDAKGGSNHI
jgi:hypothetical protein